MLGRIAMVGLPCLLGGYLMVRQNQISLTNPHLAEILTRVNNYVPATSYPEATTLLKLEVLAPDPALNKYILASGFDVDGRMLEQIKALGFRGTEVGPISFNPTQPEQQLGHLGIVSAVARICTYRSSDKKAQPFQIHLNVVPNLQVLKFAPYLTKENIIQSLNSLVQIQKMIGTKIVDRINIDFEQGEVRLEGTNTVEVQKLVKETRQEALALIKQAQDSIQDSIVLQISPQRQEYLDWTALLAYINQRQNI